MLNAPPHRLGVCSWSLQPAGPDELVARVRDVGVSFIQLALDPIRTGAWSETHTLSRLRQAGIGVVSGMMGFVGEDYSTLDTIKKTGGVRADEHWPANLDAAKATARLADRLGLKLVTFHAGFIPHARGPERTKMLSRLRQVVDAFEDRGVRVAFETGQETSATLLEALDELDRPGVGVNFDPANMILYAMGDPVAALKDLAPRVVQLHIKDALPTRKPGTWGSEEAAGGGAVDFKALLKAVRESGLGVDLLIEREAGQKRIKDARKAVKLVKALLKTGSGKP
jgi:sugar phosphate isomerase/epimerase